MGKWASALESTVGPSQGDLGMALLTIHNSKSASPLSYPGNPSLALVPRAAHAADL